MEKMEESLRSRLPRRMRNWEVWEYRDGEDMGTCIARDLTEEEADQLIAAAPADLKRYKEQEER